MKHLKKLFLLIIMSFIFILNVNAEEFTCKLGNYELIYDSSIGIKSAKNATKTWTNVSSDFKPVTVNECPTDEIATVKFYDQGTNLHVSKKDGAVVVDNEKTVDLRSCAGYSYESSCTQNDYYSCIWNKTNFGDYCNTDNLMYVQCGDAFDIPHQVPSLFSMFVNLLKIATPIVLVVIGVISLLKSLTASKEDELKKAQQSLIKKAIAAAMVFFVISIVQFVILKVADTAEQGNVSSCLSCFLNNDCSNNVYYKTNVAGTYKCTYVNGNKSTFDCKGNE